MPLPMSLYRRIRRYLTSTGMTPSRFGRVVVGDPRFVHDLQRGRQPQSRTERRVHAWLDTQGAAR